MIIAVGLFVAFILVAFVSYTSKTTRACRWRADRSQDKDGQSYFRCASCGEVAFAEGDTPPKQCMRRRDIS